MAYQFNNDYIRLTVPWMDLLKPNPPMAPTDRNFPRDPFMLIFPAIFYCWRNAGCEAVRTKLDNESGFGCQEKDRNGPMKRRIGSVVPTP